MGLIKEAGLYDRNKVLRFVLYYLYKRMELPSKWTGTRMLFHYPPEVPSFYTGHKVVTLGIYFQEKISPLINLFCFRRVSRAWCYK